MPFTRIETLFYFILGIAVIALMIAAIGARG